MAKNYFQRVRDLTPTKFWVNNVTREEAQVGIEAGAMGCTQNPSYTWKMLTHPTEKEFALKLLKESLAETTNDNEVQCILQRKLVKGISDVFMPLWEKTNGRHGYVSIQGDPIHEDDPQVIIDEGRRNREMNPNVMIKIPATRAGLTAMGVLIEEETPLNATEVMAIQQVLDVCEMYDKVSTATGRSPVMYYSIITGIFDEWLKKDTLSKGIQVNPDALHQAGMVIAKKVYNLVRDRGYRLGYIGGGVRTPQDFTEMVGGDVCITMNWIGSCDRLIAENPPVVSRLFNPVQESVIEELVSKLPEFGRAYWEGGLSVDEYEEYGPVEYFREMFVSAWENALSTIATVRSEG